VNNYPQWLNDVLRTGDKIIAEGKARDSALAQEAMLNDTRPLRQQIVEGVQGLVALAIAIVGLFIGGSAFGWIGALVLGGVGFLGAVFVFHFVGEKFSDMAERRPGRIVPKTVRATISCNTGKRSSACRSARSWSTR